NNTSNKIHCFMAFLSVFFVTCIVPKSLTNEWFYYFSLFLLMPFIFLATQKNRVDQFLGELSYPIYISHWFILHLIGSIFAKKFPQNNQFLGLVLLFLTIGLSLLLIKFIINPMEIHRKNVTNKFLSQASEIR
ncbi:MAG: hypothetical protein PUP93_33130, partial [Rhizonema sp. NSF051]|nr:hypothetical protein [Rhizonema sp. NSF051]